ncbi:DUF2971 domain-containing protein [Aeromonas veronii]|uniref:DUF2971 domain-containing protein n=1 Tax=Aeromonas veronii TaxID=654 RepID=UPI0040556404
MEIYYKYTKYLGLESIKNLYLRLSTPATLNDPFEAQLNDSVKNNILESLEKDLISRPTFKSNLDLVRKIASNSTTHHINQFGIVALSETPRNLLMWAHYANEHKGLCIGMKPDLFKKAANINTIIESYTPIKVNYDSHRPAVTNNWIMNGYAARDHYIRQQLITKSNDWMYEKEHRCIIATRAADRFKLLNEYADMSDINELIEHNELVEVDDLTYEGNSEGMMDLSVMYSNNKDGVFLKKVDTSKIDSIYIGCKFDKNQKNELIQEVTNSESKLSHVKIYECKLSKSHFELQIELLHSPSM